MIAKIYPPEHAERQWLKDQRHPVRYFDIRRTTPREAYRLMGVREKHIDTLLSASGVPHYKHYSLAGNSIVVDVLAAIYEALLYPQERQSRQADTLTDAKKPFRLAIEPGHPLRMVTLCSGYDSQCLAAELLKERHHDFSYDLIAWAECDPTSSKPMEKQPAVVAHNALFPQWADRNLGDITKADYSRIPAGQTDLLTYSTPCQSVSVAGKQHGLKRDSGTRSSVIWHTERAIQQLRPRVLIMENVRNIISKQHRPDFMEWCGVVEQNGYTNFLPPEFPRPWGKTKREQHTIAGCLNARDYGVPQHRERVFMVSVRNDMLGDSFVRFPPPTPLRSCMGDILDEQVPDKYYVKPSSVQAFLEKLDPHHDAHPGVVYVQTDHRLSDEEIKQYTQQANQTTNDK